jgi:hypothetical protein
MELKRLLPCALLLAAVACHPIKTDSVPSLYKPNLPTYSTPKGVNASITGKLISFSVLFMVITLTRKTVLRL